MDIRTAYIKGYEASKRTKTYDMEKAWDRFESGYCIGQQYGHTFREALESNFFDGWIDYAADSGYLPPPLWVGDK